MTVTNLVAVSKGEETTCTGMVDGVSHTIVLSTSHLLSLKDKEDTRNYIARQLKEVVEKEIEPAIIDVSGEAIVFAGKSK